MSSWSTRVWDDWLKNGTSYHDSDTFVEPQNSKDAVQFRTLVLAVEIDEPTAKKIREYGVKETQLSLILVIKASCLTFPINICEFFLYEKLITCEGIQCINMQGE